MMETLEYIWVLHKHLILMEIQANYTKSTRIAEDISLLDVDPDSGVYIGVFADKETDTDKGEYNVFEDDKETSEREKGRKCSISSLTENCHPCSDQKNTGKKDGFIC